MANFSHFLPLALAVFAGAAVSSFVGFAFSAIAGAILLHVVQGANIICLRHTLNWHGSLACSPSRVPRGGAVIRNRPPTHAGQAPHPGSLLSEPRQASSVQRMCGRYDWFRLARHHGGSAASRRCPSFVRNLR
jgi:hypothetical protein